MSARMHKCSVIVARSDIRGLTSVERCGKPSTKKHPSGKGYICDEHARKKVRPKHERV